MDILDSNKKFFEKLMELKDFTIEEKQILLEIYEKQTEFMKYLMEERSLLKENILQLSKKKNIGKSYVAQKIEPVFVDKDFN